MKTPPSSSSSSSSFSSSSFFLPLFLFILFRQGHAEEDLPCIPKETGHSSFVCVCNATYCDTLHRPTTPPEGQYLLYTSARDGGRFQKSLGYFAGREVVEGSIEFTLDTNTPYQTMMGWGAAFTDSAAFNILSLSPASQDQLLRAYFSPEGLEYNLGRLNMGGCDFSWRTYTHVDTPGDTNLDTFALQPEDLEYKIPVVKRAQEMSERPIKLFASPWTAPPWMKTNNDYHGFGQLKEEMYQPWARYFVRFLDDYAAQNITFWGLTAQNEPLDGYVPGFSFSCMGWTAEQQRKWVSGNLGPALREGGYGDVVLMIMDDQRINLPSWPQVVLGDPEAAQFVQGIALHWYMDKYFTPEVLTETHDLFPEYFILGTEACEGDGPLEVDVVPGSWERLEAYARDIIVDVNHWVTGWVDWNLALDMIGGPNWAENFVDAPILVDKDKDEFYKNPMFYAMGHFSKFVPEGAVRLGITSPHAGKVSAAAFRNPDGTYALILLNRSDLEEMVTVQVSGRGTLALPLFPHSLHTALFQ
ncbi:lysosomal acid glucosylceramidase-like [Portunus trituberculatus]|uniref:lysosomal acid glucosylceramidase-like n=1 Tax=Portunus trituberculatus TaxID=210409 RepID=UPI001E1D126C|nr:lysosomal acid glucosylceramidase-like [Portunus trituberculatus]